MGGKSELAVWSLRSDQPRSYPFSVIRRYFISNHYHFFQFRSNPVFGYNCVEMIVWLEYANGRIHRAGITAHRFFVPSQNVDRLSHPIVLGAIQQPPSARQTQGTAAKQPLENRRALTWHSSN